MALYGDEMVKKGYITLYITVGWIGNQPRDDLIGLFEGPEPNAGFAFLFFSPKRPT